MYVLAMNGPPRSGKDTIASLIADKADASVMVVALSMPMRLAAYAMLGIEYSVEHYEQNKDTRQPILGGTTIRQAMIALSERHVKLLYGHDFWVRSAMERVPDKPSPNLIIVTDLGFMIEGQWLSREFGSKFAICQLSRAGTDWSFDSRGYVDAGEYVMDWNNDDSPEDCADAILNWVRKYYSWDI